MKYVGWTLLGLLTVIVAAVLFIVVASLFVDPRKEYDKNSRFYRALLDVATAVGLWLVRARIHVTGIERVPKDVCCLYVSNHRSNYDSIVTWRVFRKEKLAFISKPSNFHIFAFGRIIRKCCFMAIDRENARNAIRTFHQAADYLKRQEVSVGVYPEGTRSRSKEMLPFHGGVFKIAQLAKAPVVVLAVRGCEDIAHNVPFRATDVYLDVVDVIMPEELEGVRTRVISERAKTAIAVHLEKQEERLV